MMSISLEYPDIYPALQTVAAELEIFLQDKLSDSPHIDRIKVRAKAPDSFAAKAERLEDSSTTKYESPLREIQDQIGARVIVFYQDDVEIVHQKLLEYLVAIEETKKEPISDSEFGYEGLHLILALPGEVVPQADQEREKLPDFFEIQIKTLYQHAWSETTHDLAYKAKEHLTHNQKRMFALMAAQSWGSDLILGEFLGLLKSD